MNTFKTKCRKATHDDLNAGVTLIHKIEGTIHTLKKRVSKDSWTTEEKRLLWINELEYFIVVG